MDMLWVPAGTFTMGSPTSEAGRGKRTKTEHNVTLTKGFYLGKYEVTQAQYEAVMTGSNPNSLSPTPSQWPGNPNRPVEKVSWDDAQVFLTRLNAQQAANLPAGWSYVLPTESQWEYACRAGTTTAYSWGPTIASSNANYNWDGAWNTGGLQANPRTSGNFRGQPLGLFRYARERLGVDRRLVPSGVSDRQPGDRPDRTGFGLVPGHTRWFLDRQRRDGTCVPPSASTRTPSSRNNSLGFRVGFQQQ